MENIIKHSSEPAPSTGESLLNTGYWLALFLFIVPSVAHFFVVLVGLALVPADAQSTQGVTLDKSPVYWAVSAAVAAAMLYPLLKFPLRTSDFATTSKRLGFTTIRTKPLLLSLLATCVYLAIETLVITIAGIEEPAFVVELAAQMDSVTNILMLFLATVIIAPVVEETIFRGVAFYRLKHTRLGVSGAIIVPSVIFALVHLQYEQLSVFVLLFLSAIMLGVIRHVTNNLWYCIWVHMLMNLVVFSELVTSI